jgi:hypothetical protein
MTDIHPYCNSFATASSDHENNTGARKALRGGFAPGPDALTTLTNALAAQQLAAPAVPPDVDADDVVKPPAAISGPGKATLGPKT